MRIKISKVAKDLNVGINTAVEFLRKNNVEIEENPGPNTRIDEDAVDILTKEFSKDKGIKEKSDDFAAAKKQERKEKQSSKERPRTDEIKTTVPHAGGPRILGKIDLDAPKQTATAEAKHAAESGPEPKAETKPQQPVAAKPEPKPEAKPETKVEVKPQPQPQPQPKPVQEPKPQVKPEPKTEPKAAPAARPDTVKAERVRS